MHHWETEKISCLELDGDSVSLPYQVGSVEEFQGQERKIIMVSTVRSSINYVKMDEDFNIGFLSNEKVCHICITT